MKTYLEQLEQLERLPEVNGSAFIPCIIQKKQ